MEKERLKFCIERYDHYYDSINNKNAVFLGLATFIVGGLFAGYPYLLEHIQCNPWVHLIMCILIGLGLGIMIIVILSSMPYTPREKSSILYFASICCHEKSEFEEKSKIATEDCELKDLRTQVFQLAHGLKSKFYKLRLVGVLFIIQFCLFIPLVILFTINLK